MGSTAAVAGRFEVLGQNLHGGHHPPDGKPAQRGKEQGQRGVRRDQRPQNLMPLGQQRRDVEFGMQRADLSFSDHQWSIDERPRIRRADEGLGYVLRRRRKFGGQSRPDPRVPWV